MKNVNVGFEFVSHDKIEETSEDIVVSHVDKGETLRVIEVYYDRYKLLNLSLGNPNAWVVVTREELLILRGEA